MGPELHCGGRGVEPFFSPTAGSLKPSLAQGAQATDLSSPALALTAFRPQPSGPSGATLLPLQGSGGWEACPVGARDQNRVNAMPETPPLAPGHSVTLWTWRPPHLRWPGCRLCSGAGTQG